MSDASLNVFTSPLERPFENVKYGFNDGAVDGAVVIFEDSKTRQGYVDIYMRLCRGIRRWTQSGNVEILPANGLVTE